MSPLYQGIDIVDVQKFRAVLARNPGLTEELFTGNEREYCLSRRDPSLHLASCFAAKESYLKAMGTGFHRTGIDYIFQEIEVGCTNPGKREILIQGWAARLAKRRKIRHCTLSISHASRYVVAAVLLAGD